jgi:hypothetical protein
VTNDPIGDARRITDAWRETIGSGTAELPADAVALWTDAPLIVPLRAAVDGTEYSGQSALKRFARDSVASWETLGLEDEAYTQIGEDLVLGVGRLVGRARGTGITVDNPVAIIFRFEGGRLAEFRTFTSEEEARESVA